MDEILQDFLTKFHNLEGTTIAIRRKNFFLLLHQNTPYFQDHIEAQEYISSNLKPKTFLEELLKMDFLIYFRRTEELFQILKEGNDIFVGKITKQNWFFKHFFNDIDPKKLVDDILPTMSFSVRMKILRKLSKYTNFEKFDTIFDFVTARYGIFVASKFICGCGPKTIEKIILQYNIKLNSRQLKILYFKDPGLLDFYFKDGKHVFFENPNARLVRFLSVHDRPLYEFLINKYKFSPPRFGPSFAKQGVVVRYEMVPRPIRHGRKSTKKFVKVKRNEIIQNPCNFDFLNMKMVVKTIGKESESLFRNALPAKFEHVYKIKWLLQAFPQKYHYHLYVKVVEDHYKEKFLNYPNLIDEDFLKLIKNNSERGLYAKVKVDANDDEDDRFIKFLETKDSIPLIKEKIKLTSNIHERGNLTKALIKTCFINNDPKALLQVMKYFVFRHKNDELSVHLKFIEIIEKTFGFKDFTEEMWNCLNDLLLIHTLKFDKTATTYQKIQTLPLASYNLGLCDSQNLSYLNFLFNQNKPIDHLLEDFLNHQFAHFAWGTYTKNFEKYFFLYTLKRNVSSESLDINVRNNRYLLERLRLWNLHYKEDQLSFYDFPPLPEAFIHILKTQPNYDLFVQETFKSKIFTTDENEYKEEFLEIYWDRWTLVTQNNLIWFLINDPQTILKYFVPFFEATLPLKMRLQVQIWHIVKKLHHLGLVEMSKNYCMSKLNDTKGIYRHIFVTCLSVLLKPEDYMALADLNKPVTKTIDLKNENEANLYQLQEALAENFKNTKCYKTLPSLFNYCLGDHFKFAIRSLYSVLSKTPENMLPQCLSYMSKQAVSVKKHCLYVTCALATITQAEEILKTPIQSKGAQTLKEKMFETTIKYFIKNPNDKFFDLVKTNMGYIRKNDDKILIKITKYFEKIPQEYKALYMEHTWNYLEKTINAEDKLTFLKEKMLKQVTGDMFGTISMDFGLHIVRDYIVKNKYLAFEFIFEFVSHQTEKSAIVESLFKIIDDTCDQNKKLDFFQFWCRQAKKSKDKDTKNLEPYVKYFDGIFLPETDFKNYLKMCFLKAMTLGDNNLDLISAEFVKILQNLISLYGPHVVRLFGREMSEALDFFTTEIYDFYYILISNHPIPDVANMLVNILLSQAKMDDFLKINNIIRKIKEIEDDAVQINLNCECDVYLNKWFFIETEEDLAEVKSRFQ